MSVDRDFVERRGDSFYLMGSRIPLACIVQEFQDGQSPEAIRSAFPTLTLEQVYVPSPSILAIARRWTWTWRLETARRMRSAKRIPPPPI